MQYSRHIQGCKNNLGIKKDLLFKVFVSANICDYASSNPLNNIDDFQKCDHNQRCFIIFIRLYNKQDTEGKGERLEACS